MTKEALQIALNALTDFDYDKRMSAIESIKEALKTKNEYERGFIDGMQKQMQSSVDKAVNAMGKHEWAGLTEDEIHECFEECCNLKVVDPKGGVRGSVNIFDVGRAIEAKLKEKNT